MSEWQRFKNSVVYAWDGIRYTVQTQRNMRIHLWFSVFVIPLGFLLYIDLRDLLLVLFAIFLVLITEMINTAVESTVNLATEENKAWAKIAKDTAAGAVLFAAILSIIIGIGVFGPPLLKLMGN